MPATEPTNITDAPIEEFLTPAPITQRRQNQPTPAKKKGPKLVTKCKHTDRKHYAKNLCGPCYRRFGRDIMATKCKHNDRHAYSLGLCHPCYITDYLKRRENGQLLRV